MKTDTLKFKAIAMAVVMACTTQVNLQANPIESLPDHEFFGAIIDRIKSDGIDAIFELLDLFVDKTKMPQKITYDQIIKLCEARLDSIAKNILTPIKVRFDIAQKTQPNAPVTQILEKTSKLANGIAYIELQNLIAILKKHKTEPDAKKVIEFFRKLQQHLKTLATPQKLKDLESQLTDLYASVIKEQLVAPQKLDKDAIINDIKKKVEALKNKATTNGSDLLLVWNKVLKTI